MSGDIRPATDLDLEHHAASELLVVDDPRAEPLARQYRLPPEHIPVLANRDDVGYEAYTGADIVRAGRGLPQLVIVRPSPDARPMIQAPRHRTRDVLRNHAFRIAHSGVRYDFGEGHEPLGWHLRDVGLKRGSLRADARRWGLLPDQTGRLRWQAGQTGSTTSSTSARNCTCTRRCCGQTATWPGSVKIRRICSAR